MATIEVHYSAAIASQIPLGSVFLGLTWTTSLLRFCTRNTIIHVLGWDDVSIAISLVCSRQFIYKVTSLLIPLVVDGEEGLVWNESNMRLDPQFK